MAKQYVQKMQEEGKQLRGKIYALNGYLQGTSGQAIPTEKRMLMEKKLKHMRKYSDLHTELISLEE